MSLRRWISSRGWHACSTYSGIGSLATLHHRECHVQHCPQTSSPKATPKLLKASHQTPHQYLTAQSSTPHLYDALSMSSLLTSLPYATGTGQAVDSLGKEYLCPSRILRQISDLAILDKAVPVHAFYDLPLSQLTILPISTPALHTEEMTEPPNSHTGRSSGKYAKEIMRIRHKKMKKHKLKKLRKRMYFVWRKLRIAKQNRKEILLRKEIAEIRATGDNFNPKEYVQEQLQKAKRGGYYINIFESKV